MQPPPTTAAPEYSRETKYCRAHISKAINSLRYNSFRHSLGSIFYNALIFFCWGMALFLVIFAFSIPIDPKILETSFGKGIIVKSSLHTPELSGFMTNLKILIGMLSLPFIGLALLSKKVHRKRKLIKACHNLLQDALDKQAYAG
jgi:hypothetical protein